LADLDVIAIKVIDYSVSSWGRYDRRIWDF